MTVEMLLNLAFGLGHKPEVIAYPCAAGQQPKSKGCRIPKWIEDAGPAVELFEAIIAPHQMIDLFGGCLIEQVTRRLIATKSGLTTIQRLKIGRASCRESGEVRGVAGAGRETS